MRESRKNPSSRSSQARKSANGTRPARLAAPATGDAVARPRSSGRRGEALVDASKAHSVAALAGSKRRAGRPAARSASASGGTSAPRPAPASGRRAATTQTSVPGAGSNAPGPAATRRVVARGPRPSAAAKGGPRSLAAPEDAGPRPMDPFESEDSGHVSEEETIESSKYAARAPRRFEEERFLFPHSYGVNKVRLLVRDPQWLFAHWDVDPRSFDELRRTMGERVVALSRLTLRVHDALSGGASVVLLPFGTRSWYVRADATRRSYRAELGVTLPSGEFRLLAESNTVVMPRQAPSLERARRTVRYAAGGAAAPVPAAAPEVAARAEREALAEAGPWQAPPPREAAPPRPQGEPGTPALGGASDLFQPPAPGAAAGGPGGASDVFRR